MGLIRVTCNIGLIWVKNSFPKTHFKTQPFTSSLQNSCFEKFRKIHRKAYSIEIFFIKVADCSFAALVKQDSIVDCFL